MKSRKYTVLAGLAAASLVLAGCGGSGFEEPNESHATGGATDGAATGEEDDGATDAVPAGSLELMVWASADAEQNAVQAAVDAWSAESGQEVEIIVASDMAQQLSQGFAGGNPPDLFYLSTNDVQTYSRNGSLFAYGDSLANADEFQPALRDAFTVDGQFYCAPKDVSTLALVINTGLWEEAGLTDADVPTTWEELTDVATKLTSGDVVGLAFGPEVQRIGVFMAQAGGSFVSDDGTASELNSAENAAGLQYVKDNVEAGVFAFSSDLGAGWGGEAFGKEMAAMVIEGNWITGALTNDFPDVEYTIAELPAGPAGKATIQYTNCWGIAEDADNKEGAQALAEFLSSGEQQMTFAEAFGVMPSIASVAGDWAALYPELNGFVAGLDYAINLPAQPGTGDVLSDLNSRLETIKTTDPSAILEAADKNMQAALDAN